MSKWNFYIVSFLMESVDFTTYEESIPRLLDRLNVAPILKHQRRILIKPNLINDSPPPVTTPVECCEAVVEYSRNCSAAEIIIAEGCGDPKLETDAVFETLGYKTMAERQHVALIDLNNADVIRLTRPDCPVFPEMYLPKVALDSFLISVPVLKAHSLADITGSMKNMIGLAPPAHYSGRYGTWKKAVFHGSMQQAIIDLNKYRTADLSILDATIGLAEFHLGGRHCSPPINRLIGGFDAREIDREAARLLGLEWKSIGHLQ